MPYLQTMSMCEETGNERRSSSQKKPFLGLVVSGLHGKTDLIFIRTKFAVSWHTWKSKRVSIVPSTQRKKIGENVHTANEPCVQPNPQTWDVSDLLQETGESPNSAIGLAGSFNWKQLPSPHPAMSMTHHLSPRPSVLQNTVHHHGNSQASALTWVRLD